jgi:hypothetical protein
LFFISIYTLWLGIGIRDWWGSACWERYSACTPLERDSIR